MKVLFSPSETKTTHVDSPIIDQKSFIFPDLYAKRCDALSYYESFIKHASHDELEKLFGIKDRLKVQELATSSVFTSFTCKAIERYEGVAYDYLSYATLDEKAQMWIDANVMIFSNLFGPILASNLIPHYKLHQGQPLGSFRTDIFYKEHFSHALTSWLSKETVLDLRAGFYEKFYTLSQPYITMKFLKKGKVVSHFAKAYRGEALRTLAQYQPSNEKEFADIAFNALRIMEIHETRLKREFVYEIID